MHRNQNNADPFQEDPCSILGVDPQAGEEVIRQAYLEKIRVYPPDREPEQFERIRDAYEALKDPKARAMHLLRSMDPEKPFPSLLKEGSQTLQFVGPDPWFAALEDR